MPRFPSRSKFYEWREKNPKRGKRGSATKGPLALFLSDMGFSNAVVYEECVFLNPESDRYKMLPKWAKNFIRKFDRGENI